VSESSEKKLLEDLIGVVESLRKDQFDTFVEMLNGRFCLSCHRRYAEDERGVGRHCQCENDE
jgi:hypothetical protein